MQATTIKDIARRLGISASTVSRALRNSTDVSAHTRQQILALARELNYSPNPIALSLKEKKSKVIGVVVPKIANFFCSAVIAGIEDIANSKGYHVMIFQSHENYERELANIQLLKARRVDGVLISVSNETKNGDHLQRLITGGIPVVMFDRVCDEVDTPRVVTDDTDGAYQAAAHLAEQGYKRLAHITMAPHLSVTQNRMKGYLQALKKHGLPYHKKWVLHCDFDYDEMKQAVLGLLKARPRPDAILVSGERIALSCFEVLKELRLRIPEDIALAGFFDNPISRFMNPSLTAVRQPTFDMGQSAATVLIRMIENNTLQHSYKKIELKTTLEIGQSSVRVR